MIYDYLNKGLDLSFLTADKSLEILEKSVEYMDTGTEEEKFEDTGDIVAKNLVIFPKVPLIISNERTR